MFSAPTRIPCRNVRQRTKRRLSRYSVVDDTQTSCTATHHHQNIQQIDNELWRRCRFVKVYAKTTGCRTLRFGGPYNGVHIVTVKYDTRRASQTRMRNNNNYNTETRPKICVDTPAQVNAFRRRFFQTKRRDITSTFAAFEKIRRVLCSAQCRCHYNIIAATTCLVRTLFPFGAMFRR